MKKIINGKEYTTFEAGKNATELGIDLSRKFIVVNNTGSGHKNGSILTIKQDDNSSFPVFWGNGYAFANFWYELAYYDEEPFKVGDRVKMISLNPSRGFGSVKTGDICVINKLRDNGEYSINFPNQNNWLGIGSELEKVEEPKEEKKVEQSKYCGKCLDGHMHVTVEEFDVNDWIPIGSPTINLVRYNNLTNTKPTGNKIMSNIIKFAKNLGLTADEKELREAGFQDENGNWTSDARQVVLDMKAKALKFKDFNDLENSVEGSCRMAYSSFELQALFVEYYDKLIDIAKKFNKENKK